MKFKKDDRVWLTMSFNNKLLGTISWYIHSGKWCWPPSMAYIRYYREEMVAWEVIDIYDNQWYVTEEYLKKAD